MSNKKKTKIGYFIRNGKEGFTGGIGGERERLDGDILLMMVNIKLDRARRGKQERVPDLRYCEAATDG